MENIQENKLKLVRKFVYFMMTSNFIYQLLSLKLLVSPEIKEQWVIQVTYWSLWVLIFAMLIVSKLRNNLDLIIPCLVILLIRNTIPMLDFDRKRDRLEMSSLTTFMVLQTTGVSMISISINFVLPPSKLSIPLVLIFTTLSVCGIFIISNKEQNGIIQILTHESNMTIFAQMILNSVIGLFFIQYLLNFGQIEILKAWNARDTTQKELINILENLEESIITRNKRGFGFCNTQG